MGIVILTVQTKGRIKCYETSNIHINEWNGESILVNVSNKCDIQQTKLVPQTVMIGCNHSHVKYYTRATFETSDYPRRPWDRYTAPNSKCIGAEHYVICNNHTRIDWVLLNFTPVIQQNYRHPGWKFEKLFCAVDRLSCQLELSKSETSQFRSDLVFELQKGSDRLNCNQKHFLMLHAIKINCIYIKLRAYFRVSDISAQHFLSLPPGELCFCRPEISSQRPEILYRLINMYQLKMLSCTSHLVTMPAMPPVDNYITIYIFIEKPWQALDIKMVVVYHVQMWKWIVMIFLCDISGAHGML